MNRGVAIDVLDRLHRAQNEFYGGGTGAALHDLLAPDITWTVPGASAIVGTYRGLDAVLRYFRRRRELALDTFRLRQRDILIGAGNHLAALTDGLVTIDGVEHTWSTVGLYELVDGRIATCWLLPLDQRAFDAIWCSRTGPECADSHSTGS